MSVRWIIGERDVQHRDPGCRGLDGACRTARRLDAGDGLDRAALDAALARGLIREEDSADVLDLRLCAYCHSAAGYRRLPRDVAS
jgi:hypothetical protein